MRDPDRIPIFLEHLEGIWKEYPDMRFGQLLMNIFRVYGIDDVSRCFYLEDDVFLEKLIETAKNGERLGRDGER